MVVEGVARRGPRAEREVRAAVAWFVAERFDPEQRSAAVPFYCDPERVGAFASDPEDIAAGNDVAIFRLFITLSMYQALRDVVIMRQQCSLPRVSTRVLADPAFLKRSVAKHRCPALLSADAFEADCDVSKRGAVVDCATLPGVPCHVKDATVVFNRMGDMGKLPTSAWLRVWRQGGASALVRQVCSEERSPTKRAVLLVRNFARIHRVGRKLATLFVSALSTPALAPTLTPWFPDVDGNELVVVDTNVARAVDALRACGAPRTYDARERWVREIASTIDLREFRNDLPSYSPRFVQQALYAFCSKSNRWATGDACSQTVARRRCCAPALCPFHGRAKARPRSL